MKTTVVRLSESERAPSPGMSALSVISGLAPMIPASTPTNRWNWYSTLPPPPKPRPASMRMSSPSPFTVVSLVSGLEQGPEAPHPPPELAGVGRRRRQTDEKGQSQRNACVPHEFLQSVVSILAPTWYRGFGREKRAMPRGPDLE